MARILILEDEPLIAMMLADWIDELGHEIVGPVHAIDTALAAVTSQSFDAAIIDINIGYQQSYPVADVLVTRQLPFAFATGDSPDSIEERFTGCSTLAKPYDFDTFQRVVDNLLARPGAKRPAV